MAARFDTALTRLLTRYLHGSIAEPTWRGLMRVLDADHLAGPDRHALAQFCEEAVQELEPDRVALPKPAEAQRLLRFTQVGV